MDFFSPDLEKLLVETRLLKKDRESKTNPAFALKPFFR
jgi:hypothetical protein